MSTESAPGPVGAGLSPMVHRALTDEVADAIRDAIVTGRLPVGQRVREDELAESLQVSRGPVREALIRLRAEGLIEHQSHRGATVTQLGRGDVLEIYTLRTALERLAGDWACTNATEHDLQALRTTVDGFPAAASAGRSAVGALDIAFHDAFFRAAHHDRLLHAWRSLRSQILLFLLQTPALGEDVEVRWPPSHLELLEALSARDRHRLDRRITNHVTASSRRVLKDYEGQPDPHRSPEPPPPPEFGLGPARRRVIAEEVVDAIRGAIGQGRLRPGDRLREDELAAELQVSRGPIREAILRLIEEGLVQHERHRGATVARLDPHDVDELFSLRAALERLAAGLACGVATDAEIERLNQLLDPIGEAPANPAALLEGGVARLDAAFHDALFVAAHHRRLYQAWQPLRGQITLFLGVPRSAFEVGGAAGAEVLARWRRDHQQLVNLLAERDATALQEMVADHVAQTHERALYAVLRER